MQTRPIYSTLEEVKRDLDFDRFTVVNKAIKLDLDAINDFLSTCPLSHDLVAVKKQLGIYCLFNLRDRQLSLKYLKDYRDLLKGQEHTEEYAQACSFIGHAETIDGGYQDLDEFFKALNVYDELRNGTVSENLGRAFALRYLGCMLHRKGFSFLASEYLKQALGIQRHMLACNSGVHADIAETLHLLGVFAVRQNDLPNGKYYLDLAMQSWEDFRRAKGYLHPVSFITKQSLGNLYMRLDYPTGARDLLNATYNAQVEYYGTTEQADIAKTLHFLGDVLKLTHPADALEKYLQALNIKAKLFGESSTICKVTQNAIIDVLPEVLQKFPYDWNNYKTKLSSEMQLGNILNSLKMFEPALIAKHGVSAQNDITRFQYQLGTYYLHVARDPGLALEALYKARTLKGWQLAWVEVQMAFAFQQRMFEANHKKDEVALRVNYNRAMNFVDGVINVLNDPREGFLYPIELLGYAYCVKALIIYENKDENSLKDGIATFKLALDLYDKYNLHDDQYARAKCQYARMLGENKQFAEAHKIFKELKAYWAANTDKDNIYRDRFKYQYQEFKKHLPEGYNPKIFKAAQPVSLQVDEAKPNYGFKVG